MLYIYLYIGVCLIIGFIVTKDIVFEGKDKIYCDHEDKLYKEFKVKDIFRFILHFIFWSLITPLLILFGIIYYFKKIIGIDMNTTLFRKYLD